MVECKSNHHGPLNELTLGLGWSAKTQVLFMLWGYIDESGEHENGRLVRLTVAGCLAPLEVWQQLTTAWEDLLSENDIRIVHAHELASKKDGFHSPYRGWTQKRKGIFLRKLALIMSDHIQYYIGAKNDQEMTKTATRMTYVHGVARMIVQAGTTANYAGHDGVALVLAAHPELRKTDLGFYYSHIKKIVPNLRSITIQEENSCIPLQAADLFAYEFSHCQDWHDLRNLRPVLKILRGSDATFIVNSRFK